MKQKKFGRMNMEDMNVIYEIVNAYMEEHIISLDLDLLEKYTRAACLLSAELNGVSEEII